MTRTKFIDRPNLRQAKVFGRLTIVADPPGPFNRDITYGFEAAFTCKAEDGARSGAFLVNVKFDAPVIDDPGPIESALDFIFLPVDLSTRIEKEIRKRLAAVPGDTQTFRRCLSVGVFREADIKFDAAVFDPATAQPPGIRSMFANSSALHDRATVRFHRLTRKALPPNVGASHANPGDPAAGYFNLFLNGKVVALPPLGPTPFGGIPLPPEGGSVDLNFCNTVDLTDYDRLQIIFTNDLGGAAWSQFPRAGGFGGTLPHVITTGRTIMMPGGPGLPDPMTGHASPLKPQAVVLNEFELSYSIQFMPRPDRVVMVEPPARPVGPAGIAGSIGTLDGHTGVAIDKSTPVPCREN